MERYKNLTNLTSKMLSSQPMSKIITQLLVSVSIFSSLLLSFSSLYSSSPLIMYSENLNYFSSKYSLQMILGRAMNKNCVFLICNGLLVFLAKTSGVVRSPSGTFDLNEMLQNKIGDGLETAAETETEPEVAVEIKEIPEMPLLENDIAILEEKCVCKEEEDDDDDDDEHIEVKEVISEITRKEVSIPVAEISDEEEKHEELEYSERQSLECSLFDDEHHLYGQEEEEEAEEEVQEEEAEEEVQEDEEVHGEEEEYVDEMEKMSTEELNQKFEDFIRRMKKEFRINNEATQRHQLVMVN